MLILVPMKTVKVCYHTLDYRLLNNISQGKNLQLVSILGRIRVPERSHKTTTVWHLLKNSTNYCLSQLHFYPLIGTITQ